MNTMLLYLRAALRCGIPNNPKSCWYPLFSRVLGWYAEHMPTRNPPDNNVAVPLPVLLELEWISIC
jgi:hypothetical protein